MRMIASFYKHNDIKFVSHLDMQRLFQRALRRAELPIAYSKGFNPHPLLSFATALSVGQTSDCEYFDVELTEELSPECFTERLNSALPDGVKIISAFDAGKANVSLTTLMKSAEYTVKLHFDENSDSTELKRALDKLLGGEINVMKKTKGGVKSVNIRPYVLKADIVPSVGNEICLDITGALTASGGLPLELFLNSLYSAAGKIPSAEINRNKINMDWTMLKQ